MMMAAVPEQLVEPVAQDIRRAAAQAEAERRLPGELFTRLVEAGLFSIYTPKEFGGLDLPLPEALRVVEEVSRHDGSTGWTVALGVANGYFTSMLSHAAAARVVGGGAALLAGAPALSARARRAEGGYWLTGRWGFNSGAPNAQWVAVPVPVFNGDTPVMREGGPELVFLFVPRSDVQVIDTWYVTGLRATGTQDLCAEGVFVPDEMTGSFSLPAGPHAVRPCLLTNVPFFTLFGIAQAPPVCLGLARRVIEEFRQLALGKQVTFGPLLSEHASAQAGLARAEALLRSARCYWYDSVEAVWEAASHSRELSLQDRADVRLACLAAAENSVAAADLLYRLAGTSAIFQSSALERCWRDLHTAAQHMHVQDARWETAGRVLFGMDPGSPLV